MKVCWAGGKKAAMILGDGAYKFLNVMPDIALQDFGLYVGDSGKDDAMKQVVQQLSQAALQSGNIDLLNVIKVLKADTLTEAEKVLEKGMDVMKQQQMQQQQMAMQQQQALQQAQQSDLQKQAQLKEIDNQAKRDVAQISAQSRVDVAKLQTDAQRDINDAKESSDRTKKALDVSLSQETPRTSTVRQVEEAKERI